MITRAFPRPWLDKKGRLSPLRAVTFTLLWLPALWYAARYALNDLGARPTHQALLGAGLWTIWWLIVSLTMTPAKAILGLPNIAVVRRMIGLAALFYGLCHLVLYAADEKWRLLHVASEIVLRFYLTIGFIALASLAVLGWTSRDTFVRRMGPGWKRLHRLAYLVGMLGTLHYFIQTKADVSQAVLVAGIFVWLMLWRLLPAGRDRGPLALLGLACAASVATIVLEFAWYRFGTRVDPWRVVAGEFDIEYGLRPAGQVLALGLLVATAVELRRFSITRRAGALWANILVYAAGAMVVELGALAIGFGDPDAEWPEWLLLPAIWVGLSALMGVARWLLAERPARWWLDALWAGCLATSVVSAGLENPSLELGANALVLVAILALAIRLWAVSRASAVLVAPVAAWLVYVATTQL